MEFSVEMEFERETKRTHRFKEVEGQQDLIGTIYISKRAFPSGRPDTINVTVETYEKGST